MSLTEALHGGSALLRQSTWPSHSVQTEEIFNRPISFAKPFLSRIGPANASRIRIITAEYSAAAEELFQLGEPKPYNKLTGPYLRSFLSTFHISIPRLRVLAISIVPYGNDHATEDLMWLQARGIRASMLLRTQWLESKNESAHLRQLVRGICEREEWCAAADFWADVDRWVGFRWSAPYGGREWIVHTGTRGRGDEGEGVGGGVAEEGVDLSLVGIGGAFT